MSSDVWIGAVTTLAGGGLGGAISFVLSRQQIREARRQRQEEDARDRRRRSADRRFEAYADFLTRARSFRNAAHVYYRQSRHQRSLKEIDSLLQSANDASALVFLVVEDTATYEGCRSVLRALFRTRDVMHGIEPAESEDPWEELNIVLGRATRDFQNAARNELDVTGPAEPWDDAARAALES